MPLDFALWTRALLLTAASVTVSAVLVSPAAAASETVIQSFGGSPDAYEPEYGLALAPDGNLYGTSRFGGKGAGSGSGVVFQIKPPTRHRGAIEKVIYYFRGKTDGKWPEGPLVFDADGNAYGTAISGGAVNNCNLGCGTVFKLSPPPGGKGRWSLTVLHHFNSAAGSSPTGALTFDSEGNLYGATLYGGGDPSCTGDLGGCGVIYRLSPPGSGTVWDFTTLYRFRHETGAVPNGGLVFDKTESALYGTAEAGGASQPDGVAFKLAKPAPGHTHWTYSVLYNFLGLSQGDGSRPYSGLVFDAAGNLFGTTELGGSSVCSSFAGCGLIFELSPAGQSWTKSTVHVFTGGQDGRNPYSGLTADGAGNMYGTTSAGGSFLCGNGCGAVYQLTPNGGSLDYSVIYGFGNAPHDGLAPQYGPLVWDGRHTLYGTTVNGGAAAEPDGTAYAVTLP